MHASLKFLASAAVGLCLALAAPALAGDQPAPAARFHNDLGMEFVLIKPGSFSMGSPASDPERDPDETQHQVTISKPFYMQTTEVTLGQWRALMGTRLFGRQRGRYDRPVVKVSWFDAMKFIKKLNSMGKGTYRLPTEAEWEYSCRAGSTTRFSWGGQASCGKAVYSNNSLKSQECIPLLTQKGLADDQAAPVKTFAPNAWGLYDMHGNVWEWCSDWYAPYDGKEVRDPTGPDSGEARVRRGGSWYAGAIRIRSANRNFANPSIRYDTLGFRLVKEVSP